MIPFLYLIQILIIISWAFGYLGARWWIFDLFSHFKIHYVVGSASVLAGALYYQDHSLAILSYVFLMGVLLASRLMAEILDFKKTKKIKDISSTVTLMSFNVWKDNENYSATIDHIRRTQPDIVGLYETNSQWEKAFGSLRDIYPHQIFYPGKGRFGMTLLSKYPVQERNAPQTNPQRVIVASVTIPSSNRALHIYALHPYSPEGRRHALTRNHQLREMETWVNENADCPMVIMGDFNASPWSHPLKSILKRHKLVVTKPHKCGTWPSLLGEFGIPIDHILTKNVVANTNGHIGPHLGSDHRPVHASIKIV